MHVAFFCLCGVFDDISFGLLDFLFYMFFCLLFLFDLYDLLCLNNRISFLRLRGISLLCLWDLIFNSISGVLSRSCGLIYDCRLFNCYEIYSCLCFDFSFCCCGDAQDRFCLRCFDMRNSCLLCITFYFFFLLNFYFVLFVVFCVDSSIELIIYLFLCCWCLCIIGFSFCLIEHPKGDYCLSFLLFNYLFCRFRLRCADYVHILLVDCLCRGFLLADLCAVIGNIDCVFGSVDR